MPSPRTLLSSGPVVLGGVLRGRAQAWPLPPSPCPQPPPPAMTLGLTSGTAQFWPRLWAMLRHPLSSLGLPSILFLIPTALPQKPSCCPKPPPQAAFTQSPGDSHCPNPPSLCSLA